jgi:hypothetical protein
MTTDIIPHAPSAPVNVAGAFDPAIPLPQRIDALQQILELAALLSIERDRMENPDAYADEDFCRQEVLKRTFKGAADLRQIANVLELRCAMELDNGHETWLDEDGAEVSLLEVIEHQMPDEEQRNSSGRARQVWSFLDAAQAFREQGISDRDIAGCATSGLSSVLGITAAAQRKLATVIPEEGLQDAYRELIGAAAETTKLSDLKKKVGQMVGIESPSPIPYSAEVNCQHTWVIARMDEGQFLNLFWARMEDVLERNELLPEDFVQFWRQDVPAGQSESARD